jgi:hypothetical protein
MFRPAAKLRKTKERKLRERGLRALGTQATCFISVKEKKVQILTLRGVRALATFDISFSDDTSSEHAPPCGIVGKVRSLLDLLLQKYKF